MLFCTFSCLKDTSGYVRTFPVLGDSLSIEQSCIAISRHLSAVAGDNDTAFLSPFYRVLDSIGNSLAASLGDARKTTAAADSIVKVVYKTWGIGFDQRDMAPEALLPHLVYKTKKGACLGVSLIILMLAEKIGCPLYGVMLPGHFFCRFDNGTVQRTIEPNKSGFNHPDDYYRDRYPVAKRPWYDLRHNLSKQETIGVLCYNAGAICMNYKNYNAAVLYCRQAMKRLNDLPEATGNCALAYAQKGAIDSSLMLFNGLYSSYPGLVNCAANYGTVLMAAKQFENACVVFRKGLEYFPDDTVLRKGLEKANKSLQAP
jgi:regulator of sirC expression with transglutaminase-like and TPR domain